MLRAISQLKKREDIVITKPDKGSGIVVMDKSDYVRLLKESSINDETKFAPVSLERPKTRGRPPKFYHPLLQKEKEVSSAVQRILPKSIADSVVQKIQTVVAEHHAKPCVSTLVYVEVFSRGM